MSNTKEVRTPLAFVETIAKMTIYTPENAREMNAGVDAIAVMLAIIPEAREILDNEKLGVTEGSAD